MLLPLSLDPPLYQSDGQKPDGLPNGSKGDMMSINLSVPQVGRQCTPNKLFRILKWQQYIQNTLLTNIRKQGYIDVGFGTSGFNKVTTVIAPSPTHEADHNLS